jgi:hypothetical protein
MSPSKEANMAVKKLTTRTTPTQQNPRRSTRNYRTREEEDSILRGEERVDALLDFAIAATRLGRLDPYTLDSRLDDKGRSEKMEGAVISAKKAYLALVGGEAPELMIRIAIECAVHTANLERRFAEEGILRAGAPGLFDHRGLIDAANRILGLQGSRLAGTPEAAFDCKAQRSA